VYLFGSQARGQAGPLSDFDIGVLFNNRITEKNILVQN
jgi:predicted nucleotidyltransferase